MIDCTKSEISVIVPVYSAEKYLVACVDSILQQSFTDFELILVDDGSPDHSGTICDRYLEKDSRIRVIHKENGGVSSARNAGLDHAEGRYVVFVDSDDYLGRDYLRDLYVHQSRLSDVETFVISDYQPFTENGEEFHDASEPFTVSLCGENADAGQFRKLVFGFLIFPPYCKLYRRIVIKEHELRFNQKLRSAEDFDFNWHYIRHMKRISYIPSLQYHYRVDYKEYVPSNDGILGQSEIMSAHIMAHGIVEIAERMGIEKEVWPEICLWAAKKHYFNRMRMLFAPNKRLGYRARKLLYHDLIADKLYRDLANKGIDDLPISTTKRIAKLADWFPVWWGFYQVSNVRVP